MVLLLLCLPFRRAESAVVPNRSPACRGPESLQTVPRSTQMALSRNRQAARRQIRTMSDIQPFPDGPT